VIEFTLFATARESKTAGAVTPTVPI